MSVLLFHQIKEEGSKLVELALRCQMGQREFMDAMEKAYNGALLRQYSNNISRAAAAARIHRNTLARQLDKTY